MSRDARRLEQALTVTARAVVRLRSSLTDDDEELRSAIALGEASSDKQLLRVLDSFVQRFQQVHEHMTHRLYPALYRVEELGDRAPPMLKLLQWLEGIGLVASAPAWGRYAEARNRLVHEYPLDAADRTEALRLAIDYSAEMIRDFDRVVEHVRSRDLLEDRP